MMTRPVYIAGSGSYLPGKPVSFDHIDDVLGSLDGAPEKVRRWIDNTRPVMKELLDISSYYYAIDPVTKEFTDDNVTMATKAAGVALNMAGISPDDVDLITYGSPHMDQMPTPSVRIQEALGIEMCDELSIHANCTSAYKALYLARELIASGRNTTALVISANISSSELRSSYLNLEKIDREALFLRWFLCDGAGAIVLTSDKSKSCGYELEDAFIESVGGKRPSLMFNERPAFWMNPLQEYEEGRHHLRQRFRNELSSNHFQESDGSVFIKGFKRMLARSGRNAEEISLFQVNLPAKHITESVMDECETMGIPRSAFYTKLDTMGYCGPPMALICLDSYIREGALAHGARGASFVTEVSKFMQAGYIVRRD